MLNKLTILSVLIFLLISCKSENFDVDVSDIDIEIKTKRFDLDLFKYPADSTEKAIDYLSNKYESFFELYSQRIIKLGKSDNPVFPSYFKRFMIDYRITLAKQEIDKNFPNLDELDKELTDIFKHYKYYFPDKVIPEVISCITGFNESIILTDDYIAIALDKYLGSDCELYTRIGIDKYKSLKMTDKMIPIDVATSWIESEYEYNDSVDNLATRMIYNGKIQYALDALLPNYPKKYKFAFSDDQLYWAEKNEAKIWDYFKKQKLVYSTDKIHIAKYINDAPFTAAFSANSAPRTGVFIGRKIVGTYMLNHPEITLEQLLENRDYIDILLKSKYNP